MPVVPNMNLMRRWSARQGGQKSAVKSADNLFSIMSFNVLAPSLVQEELFRSLKQPWSLDWNARWFLIWNEISQRRCDIVALQEIDQGLYHSVLNPSMNALGYVGIYRKRTSDGMFDGEALFVNEEAFRVVRMGHIDFEQPDHPTLGSSLDRFNVAVWADLVSKRASGDKRLIVASTHLLFNPKRGDVKLAQAHVLMTELKKIAEIPLDSPPAEASSSDASTLGDKTGASASSKSPSFVICGDMNICPGSPCYEYLTQGRIGTANTDCTILDRRVLSGQVAQMRAIAANGGSLAFNKEGHRGCGSTIVRRNAPFEMSTFHSLGEGFANLANPLGSLVSAYAEGGTTVSQEPGEGAASEESGKRALRAPALHSPKLLRSILLSLRTPRSTATVSWAALTTSFTVRTSQRIRC